MSHEGPKDHCSEKATTSKQTGLFAAFPTVCFARDRKPRLCRDYLPDEPRIATLFARPWRVESPVHHSIEQEARTPQWTAQLSKSSWNLSAIGELANQAWRFKGDLRTLRVAGHWNRTPRVAA